MAEVKFCGLTRAVDAALAVELDAAYVGVIFAGGPRTLEPARAAEVLAPVAGAGAPRRVGVFGDQSVSEIAEIVERVRLDVAQLHGEADPARVHEVRAATGGQVWGVARVAGTTLPPELEELAEAADAVVLDARVEGMLGGTGVALPWEELAEGLARIRERGPIVLAGGLRPENVERAVAALRPAVADVSSGVETAPGIKDHQRMRAFRAAVERAGPGEKR